MSESNASTMGVQDVLKHFKELLERVAAGAEVTITEHGSPVARLVPIKRPSTPEARKAAIDRIKRLSQGVTLGGLQIRELLDEGRR